MTTDRVLFIFFAALAVLWISVIAVSAQDYPAPTSPRFDVLMIEDGHIDGTALVTFGNDASMGSDGGWFDLTADNGIAVRVFIEVNVADGNAERITVYPPDNLMAWPVEADVEDGDEVVITISPPMM